MRTQMVTHVLVTAMGMISLCLPSHSAAPRATHSHILKLSRTRANLRKETFTALSLAFHSHPEPNHNKPTRETLLNCIIPWHNIKKTDQTYQLNFQSTNEKEGCTSPAHHFPIMQTNPGPICWPKWHVNPL